MAAPVDGRDPDFDTHVRVAESATPRHVQIGSRYKEHCKQHVHLLDLLERGRDEEASKTMQEHLSSTLRNLKKISSLLKT